MGSTQDVIAEVLTRLRPRHPSSGALEIGMPYHMLVLVALSARTRDEQVLKLAPAFFAAFPSVQHLAKADVKAIAQRIDSIGLFQQKAKNLKGMAEQLVSEFGGVVPSTIEELTTLPGVGRKTASVVLVAAFGKAAIAVDVHVFRVVQRLGWAKGKTPEELEKKLLKIVPEEMQADVNHVFVPFGRSICTPQPKCYMCPLRDICALPAKNLAVPKDAEAIVARIAESERTLAEMKQSAKDAVE